MSQDTHAATSSEITYEHHMDDSTFKKRIYRTTIILSVITVIELAFGFLIYFLHKGEPSHLVLLLVKGVICILTLAKAYYIISVFMHLGDEIRNFIMTVVIPLLIFIWFIAAFLIDGHSFKNLRNKYDKHFEETTMPTGQPAIPSEHHQYKGGRQ